MLVVVSEELIALILDQIAGDCHRLVWYAATSSPHTRSVYANRLQFGQESERLVPQTPQLTRATRVNVADLSD